MTDRRRIIIEWSPMDDEYVAYTQDAPAISALGESRGEALRELEVVLMMVAPQIQEGTSKAHRPTLQP